MSERYVKTLRKNRQDLWEEADKQEARADILRKVIADIDGDIDRGGIVSPEAITELTCFARSLEHSVEWSRKICSDISKELAGLA